MGGFRNPATMFRSHARRNPIVVPPGDEPEPPMGGMVLSAPPVGILSLPNWLFPPADAQAFDFVKYIALPAVSVIPTAIIDFIVPEGMDGIIKRFGNVYVGSGFTEGSGSLEWQLLANGQPIPNYEDIPASLGATANPSEVSSIRISQGQRIQLVIINLSLIVGGAFTGGRLGGWFYPKNSTTLQDWG